MPSQQKLPTVTTSLHGIRTIFNISVIILHALVFSALGLDDPSTPESLTTGSIPAHILSFVSTLGNASVDIFFLLSGFLLKASLPHVTPYTALQYTIFRYLRLAPTYLTISYAFRCIGLPNCIKPAEALLLPFTNLDQLCIGPGWSTSVDFLSHIVLLPLLPHPIILCSFLILSPLLRAWTWIRLGKPLFPAPTTLADTQSSDERINFLSHALGIPRGNFSMSDPKLIARRNEFSAYSPLYFGTAYRIVSVFVGVLLYTSMSEKNRVYRKVRRFPMVSVLCMSAVWAFYDMAEQRWVAHPWVLLFHESTSRMLITMATSILIILTCCIEDDASQHVISRFLRSVLSCWVFRWLHRFSYIVYLLHVAAAPVLAGIPPRLTKERVTPVWILVMGMKWYMCTIVLGLGVWGVEWVALRARRWLLRRLSGAENDSVVKKKTS